MRIRTTLALAAVTLIGALALGCGSGGGGAAAGSQTIAAGDSFTCSLTDGLVYCWGSNYYGQIGTGKATGDFTMKTEPVALDEPAVSLAAGADHACAAVESGRVFCWGRNKYGELGAETLQGYTRLPVEVEGLADSVAVGVGAGYGFSCAILDNGGLRCWGWNDRGQLGNGERRDLRDEPDYVVEKVGGLRDIVQVDGGSDHACALAKTGEVYCWGYNGDGRLGDGTMFEQLRPTQVAGLPAPVTAIALGEIHTCAIVEPGDVYCWGKGIYGQLGDGTGPIDLENPEPFEFDVYGGTSEPPKRVEGIDGEAELIAAAYAHTCVATASGDVYCWGFNADGQLGFLEDSRCMIADPCQPTAAAVEYLPDNGAPISITAGRGHTCVAYGDGAASCWGRNGAGELGDGTEIDSLEPVTVLESAPEDAS